jgi:predicted aspartyl protease
MRFAYRPLLAEPSPTNETNVIFRPELKVLVRGMGRRATEVLLWGLVDTGAVECVLPLEVADRIGASMLSHTGSIRDFTGINHSVEYGLVQLQICLKHQRFRWTTAVAFARELEGTAFWGRDGFLNHFSVTFNGPCKYFTIRRRNLGVSGIEVISVPRPTKREVRRSDLITPDDQDP